MKTATREKGIIFSAPMVRAILENRKTQHRVVCKTQPQVTTPNDAAFRDAKSDLWRNASQYTRDCCPYPVGTRLYVKETWQKVYELEDGQRTTTCQVHFKRVFIEYLATVKDGEHPPMWRSAVHMPAKYARIWLEVKSVRVERVQSISREDIEAEGIPCKHLATDRHAQKKFAELWDSLHPKHPFDSGPYVWVIEFGRVSEGTRE